MDEIVIDSFAKKTIFKILENQYEVKPITAGNVIDIESNKLLFSNGTYKEMLQSNLYGATFAQEIVECFAVLEVLLPKNFKDDLKVKSLFELDLKNTLELIKQYKEQLSPMYVQIIDLFKGAFEENNKAQTNGA